MLGASRSGVGPSWSLDGSSSVSPRLLPAHRGRSQDVSRVPGDRLLRHRGGGDYPSSLPASAVPNRLGGNARLIPSALPVCLVLLHSVGPSLSFGFAVAAPLLSSQRG